MKRSVCKVMMSVASLLVLGTSATLVDARTDELKENSPGALAGSAMSRAPAAAFASPSEPNGIPTAIDAAITGPAARIVPA